MLDKIFIVISAKIVDDIKLFSKLLSKKKTKFNLACFFENSRGCLFHRLTTSMVCGFFPGDVVPSSGRRLIFRNVTVFSLAEGPRRAQERARGLKMNFANSCLSRDNFKAKKNIDTGKTLLLSFCTAYIYRGI